MIEETSEQKELEAEIRVKADEFLECINNILPANMELEYEGFYRRGFFVSKKRYAVLENGDIVAKGLELVRRDWAPVVKNTQQAILKYILEEGDSNKAVEELKRVFKLIRTGEINKEELIIHTQLTRSVDEYKQIGPHVVAAKMLEDSGAIVTKGTIVRYIIVKGRGSISERAMPYEFSANYEYDKDYYINNQLIPAMERIMYSFGYSKKDLQDMAYGEVQQSLDAFF